MKKLFTLLVFILSVATFAQAPQGFNYQATVRNAAGTLMVNQNVFFKFNIMLNTQTSNPIYSETHDVPTDDLGQVNLTIGKGTATTGIFSAINWGAGNYYLGVELNSGSGYVAMGTSQLLSVPYALYANSSGSTQTHSKTSIYLTRDISNAEAAAKIATELGPDTENIYIRNTTQLTSVDLSTLASAVNISITDNAALTNVNLNGLITVYENLNVWNNPLLNLSLQVLSDCNVFNVDTIASLNASNMKGCNEINFSNITNFTPLANLSSCNNLNLYKIYNSALNFSSLANCNNISITGNSLLSTVTFPTLNVCKSLNITGNSLLSTITFLALKDCSTINLSNNALQTANINSLLHQMLTVSPSSVKSIDLSGQTPSAPPTGEGILDKLTLIYTNNTVLTDATQYVVNIGSQIWQNTNLDVSTYSDGTLIPEVTDQTQWANLKTGAWCYYNNDPANGAIYGKLYNWYAVAGIYDEASLNDASLRKQLAPQGYHVPSYAEWKMLTDFLGGEAVAGGKMKETGIIHWKSPNAGATNSSDFTALPAGLNSGGSQLLGTHFYWWLYEEYNTTFAGYSVLFNQTSSAERGNGYKTDGLSVRCIKD